MKRIVRCFLLIVTIAFTLLANGWSKDAEEVLKYVNIERAKRHLKPLRLKAGLQKHSEKRARQLVKDFSHRGAFRGLKGYGCMGENIALGYKTPKAVVKGWMKSKGHRANILSKRFTCMGVSRYKGRWAQNFGGPFRKRSRK